MKDVKRKTWAALAVFAVFVVLAAGYHAGKDLALRDNQQQVN
jgi:hypothetical protein